MNGKAILKDKKVVHCDLETWARWLESHYQERVIGKDIVNNYRVSTVFLGLDYGWDKPLWFETLIFPGHSSSVVYMERYETYDKAVDGHKKAIEIAKIGKFER